MTQPLNWGNDYFSLITQLVDTLEQLRTKEDMIVQDSSLPAAYLTALGTQRADLQRPDLANFDISSAGDAVNILLAAFDGGTPTVKARLFKVL